MLKRSLVVGLLAANVLMTGCGQKADEGAKEGSTDAQTEQNLNSEAPPVEEATTGEAEVDASDAPQEEEEKPPEEKKPEKKSSKKKSKSK